jgi:hypothetical protein
MTLPDPFVLTAEAIEGLPVEPLGPIAGVSPSGRPPPHLGD